MRTLLAVALLLALCVLGLASVARADGCYICGRGSAPACRDFCRYGGPDTFDNRHKCQAKGCNVVGPSSCPADNAPAKVCRRPSPADIDIAWCAPAPAPPLS